jgi:glycosyltransferase involved in cell wall biosynthesis
MLGVGDAGLDDPQGEPVRRHLEYARRAGGHIDLVVDSPRSGVSEYGALTVHRTGAGRARYPWAAFRLGMAAARQRPPDLITSQDPFATGLAGLWLRRALRRPLLVQNHSCFLFDRYWIAERPLFFRGLHLLARYVLPRADAWRTVNTAEARIYRERLGLPAEKVKVIPVPCDLAAYSGTRLEEAVVAARRRLALPADARLLLWAGRPVRFKRLPLLFEAFAGVRKDFPSARLILAGRRTLAQENLDRAAVRCGVEKSVVWVDGVSHDELAGFYGAAEVFLLSSIYEGFGRVLVEAGAVGLPVVATATAGASDILRDGVTGFLTAVENAGALAERTAALLADPGLRGRMGAAARARVGTEFDPQRLFEAVVAQWREVAAMDARR